MPKYHVNTQTGESGLCKVTTGVCPFGSDDEHFDTIEKARSFYEESFSLPMTVEKKIPESDVKNLIKELLDASQEYYQGSGESELSDEEFDAKQAYLHSLSDSGQYQHLFTEGTDGYKLLDGDVSLGTQTNSDEIVHHEVPMLSLNKAKKEEDLMSFLDKTRKDGATSFRLQAKLDGLAISVYYKEGKISRIATRGDGSVGEDVTYLIKDPSVKVQGLPLYIEEKEKVEVRGELFFTNDQFKKADDERFKLTGEHFKNSRNSATGLLKKAKLGIGYPVEFTFSTYSTLKNGVMKNLKDLSPNDGFLSVDDLTETQLSFTITNLSTNKEVMDAINEFGKVRPGFSIPTDGVVIKPSNEGEMYEKSGVTSHHPVSQIAWKYPAEKAKTTVIGINLTVGKSGRVTPVAKVEPVNLAGSEISNASLHNFNLIHQKDIRVGSIVLIEKANDIIPQVVAVLSNPEGTEKIQIPNECPSCKGKLSAKREEAGVWPPKTLNCNNPNCPSRDYFALKTAVGKNFLDIDKLSEVTLNHFNEIGRVNDISDLYTLTKEELSNSVYGYSNQGNPRRLGEKIAEHILEHLELSKKRPLTKVLPSLNIDLLGPSTAKALVKRFGDIDGILNAKESEIAVLDGLGDIKAKKIYDGLRMRSALIQKLRDHGVEFTVPQASQSTDDSSEGSSKTSLNGLSFAISGSVPPGFSNRNAWVDYIESNGGIFHSSPKKDTSYIIGDESSTSSKTVVAKKLGLKFMSPEDFSSTFNS